MNSLFCLFLIINAINAQPALISWEVKEANKGDDFFTKSIQISNGNLATIGNFSSTDGLKNLGLLSLIDYSTGKIIKKVTFGNQNEVFINDLIEMPDGNLFLIGYSSFNKMIYPWVTKVDANGNKIFEKVLPLPDGSTLNFINEDLVSGYYLSAKTKIGGIILIHLNKEAEITWQKELISESWGDLKKMSVGINGNIFLAGNTKKGGGQNSGDVWITSLDKKIGRASCRERV